MKRGVNECQRLLRCPDLRSKRSGHLLRFTLYPVANAHCHSHISIPTVLWIASSQYLPTNVGISIILRYQRVDVVYAARLKLYCTRTERLMHIHVGVCIYLPVDLHTYYMVRL